MQLPHRLGRYLLTEKIGQGGMAEIYRAKQAGDGKFAKEIVIKRLLPAWFDNQQINTMLIDEAHALVRLSHPNIVQVFELGREGEIPFIAMEYVEGIDLKALLNKIMQGGVEVPLKYILFIVSEALRALDYAHERKDDQENPLRLVHRDVSPQNILLSYDGAVKVTDFGIAKGEHRSLETTVAQVKGKYAYMSPEQASGQIADAQTDIYAMGIVLYELLAKRRRFDADNDLALLELVRQGGLMSEGLEKIPGMLKVIIFKALDPDKMRRYKTAKQFLTDLHRFAQQDHEMTNGFELGEFLQGIFAAERKEHRSIGMQTAHETKVFERGVGAKGKMRRWVSGVLVVFLASGGVFWWSQHKAVGKVLPVAGSAEVSVAPILPISVSGRGAINIDTVPSGVSGTLRFGDRTETIQTPFTRNNIDLSQDVTFAMMLQKEGFHPVRETVALSSATPAFVKTYVLAPIVSSQISVQARPWGMVTILGVVTEKETPVAGISVKPGSYTLAVHYPPHNQSVETTVKVGEGQKTICLADFTQVPPTIRCH